MGSHRSMSKSLLSLWVTWDYDCSRVMLTSDFNKASISKYYVVGTLRRQCKSSLTYLKGPCPDREWVERPLRSFKGLIHEAAKLMKTRRRHLDSRMCIKHERRWLLLERDRDLLEALQLYLDRLEFMLRVQDRQLSHSESRLNQIYFFSSRSASVHLLPTNSVTSNMFFLSHGS